MQQYNEIWDYCFTTGRNADLTQPKITCSKSAKETMEQGVKSVQISGKIIFYVKLLTW